MKKPSEVLSDAKELIRDPLKLTKSFLARNKLDNQVDPLSPVACKWCSVGAVIHVAKKNGLNEEIALPFLRTATKDWGYHGQAGSPAIMTDNRSHEEIMKLFDRAIELAKEKE